MQKKSLEYKLGSTFIVQIEVGVHHHCTNSAIATRLVLMLVEQVFLGSDKYFCSYKITWKSEIRIFLLIILTF